MSVLRRRLMKRLPASHEIVYEYRDAVVISYSPTEHGYDGVVAIRASANDVKLYLQRGKELADPEKLLKGSGGLARFVEIDSPTALARPAVARLIEEAIRCTPVPFAKGGKGSVIIRSTTAGKANQKVTPKAGAMTKKKAISKKASSKKPTPRPAKRSKKATG